MLPPFLKRNNVSFSLVQICSFSLDLPICDVNCVKTIFGSPHIHCHHFMQYPAASALWQPHFNDIDLKPFVTWISTFLPQISTRWNLCATLLAMRPHSATAMDFADFGRSGDILNKDVPACVWKVFLLTSSNKQSWPANPVRKHKPLVPSFALATNLIGRKFYSHMDSKLLLYLETIFPCTVFVWQFKMDLRWI